jgi:hypothetical protein
MLAAYVETANEIEKMDALQFFARYGEASRVIRHLAGTPDANAMEVFDLHRRHAKQVTGVIDRAFAQYGSAIRKRELPVNCLLRLVFESGPSHHEQNGRHAPAAVSRESAEPANYIRRKGQCWAVRFGGAEERIYTPDGGFAYLQILVENPTSCFTASELYCQMRRNTGEWGAMSPTTADLAIGEAASVAMGADAVLDDEARTSLGLRLVEIARLLEKANGSTSSTRFEEIQKLNDEKDWLTEELRKAEGRGGRARLLGDDRNRVRNRVCNAIRRSSRTVASTASTPWNASSSWRTRRRGSPHRARVAGPLGVGQGPGLWKPSLGPAHPRASWPGSRRARRSRSAGGDCRHVLSASYDRTVRL